MRWLLLVVVAACAKKPPPAQPSDDSISYSCGRPMPCTVRLEQGAAFGYQPQDWFVVVDAERTRFAPLRRSFAAL